MHKTKICLASDNWAGIHPAVMQAIIDANQGYAPSYGADQWTEKACRLMQETFKTPCKAYIVPSGTGSNVFGLLLACRRYESIVCTDIAHIDYQESGAAESIIGAKLLTVPHQEGKATPGSILKKLQLERAFGKHSTRPRVLSIAQPTEVGTVYRLDELAALSKLCKEEKLLFHIDGSRLYNAAAGLGVELADMVAAGQPDLLSLGGTKNGLMGAEALLIFNPELMDGSDHLQKQALQLMSKMRFLSVQFIPFFEGELWRTLALRANQRAQELAECIRSIPHLSLSYPVESNQVFFTAPSSWIPRIQEEISCYLWDRDKCEIRFIPSWNTSEEEIKAVQAVLMKISAEEQELNINV